MMVARAQNINITIGTSELASIRTGKKSHLSQSNKIEISKGPKKEGDVNLPLSLQHTNGGKTSFSSTCLIMFKLKASYLTTNL